MKEDISIITTSANPHTVQVLLEGQLVIRNAKTIKNELIVALTDSQNIVLVLRHIIKMDLAVMQLLIALQKSAAKLGKNLSFDFELTEYIKSVMQHSGLAEIFIENSKNAE